MAAGLHDGVPTTLQIPEHLRLSFEDDETLPTLLSISRLGGTDSKVTASPGSCRRLAMMIATKQAAIRENAAKQYLGEKPKPSNSTIALQDGTTLLQLLGVPRKQNVETTSKAVDKLLPFPDVLNSTMGNRNLPFPEVGARASRDRDAGAVGKRNLPFPEAGCPTHSSRLPFPEAGLPAQRGRPRTSDNVTFPTSSR